MEATPSPENQTSNPSRLPFDAEFVKHVEEFCTTIMTAVPELHALTIVPIWENQPENMPAGLLHLRNPQPPYIPSLLAALKRLTVFHVDLHRDLVGQIGQYERYVAQLSAEAQTQLEVLNKLATDPTNGNDPK
jgi:hypothetical protein